MIHTNLNTHAQHAYRHTNTYPLCMLTHAKINVRKQKYYYLKIPTFDERESELFSFHLENNKDKR